MTTLGATLIINGQITSREDVTIHGKVTGKISVENGALLIAAPATVEADAQVSRMTIEGSFAGEVEAVDRIELTNTANVNGTLMAPAVVIQDGAVFNGMLEVTGRKGARAEKAFTAPIAKAS